jgi:hypothetical protein
MKNSQTTTDERVTRPIKVLTPLIKADLEQLKRAEVKAAELLKPWRIAIGEKLNEAKPQLNYGRWARWLRSNFRMSLSTASEYMRMAKNYSEGAKFANVEEFRKSRRGYAQAAERVRAFVEGQHNYQFAHDDRTRREGLVVKRAHEIIAFGYKGLATKLHPDKGGSVEAMQQLNDARDMLKKCLK